MPKISNVLIRDSREEDIQAITDIYAHYVLHSCATFEETPPPADEIARRRQSAIDHGFPHIVAETGGNVLGVAYASMYRTRAAYRFTVENSIYVHPAHLRTGIGRLLLSTLIESCDRTGCRQMIAVIGGKDNAPSIALHESFGFKRVGLLPSVGFKFGGWADTVLMQRAIGEGDSSRPQDR